MRTSDTTAEVFSAMIAANEDLTNPIKSEEVQAGPKTFSFVPLPDLLDHVRPVLRKHGLAIIQEGRTTEGFAGVATRLIHTSGEWIEYEPLFIPSAPDAQSIGSVITYGCRYTLCAALGISGDKDDERVIQQKKSDTGTRDTSRTDTAPSVAAATVVPVSDPTSEEGEASVYGEGTRPDPSSDPIGALIAAFGTNAKALIRARKTWPDVVSISDLTLDQVTTLLGEAT